MPTLPDPNSFVKQLAPSIAFQPISLLIDLSPSGLRLLVPKLPLPIISGVWPSCVFNFSSLGYRVWSAHCSP